VFVNTNYCSGVTGVTIFNPVIISSLNDTWPEEQKYKYNKFFHHHLQIFISVTNCPLVANRKDLVFGSATGSTQNRSS